MINMRWSSVLVLIGFVGSLLALPLATYAQSDSGGSAAPSGNSSATTFPVQGTGKAADGTPVTLAGQFHITRFQMEGGALMAIGRLNGTVTAAGKDTPVPDQDVRLPVQSINGKALPTGPGNSNGNANNNGNGNGNGQAADNSSSPAAGDTGAATTTDDSSDTGASDMTMAQAPSCNILNLVLGPLHLNLLGLVVDLNQVILNITGQTGAGNLLGNLLCAVAGLLNPPTGTSGGPSLSSVLPIVTNLLNSVLDILNLGLT